ncbi:MAG: hypothetical protein PHU64_01720 [Candidatus Omnitrophica bacterium]|nr:hypothetical protein [Candidatus Omnitrophota bacterium]MDD5429221.1 hypothetical protein [Candidatus Omnitrophota bacterium]
MDKEKKKLLQRRAGWFAIRGFTIFSGVMPLSWNYFLGKVLGSIAYLVVARHRKIALESLEVAFPQTSLRERKKITRDFFVSMAQGSFELLHYLRNLKQLDNIRIEGKSNLDKALKNQRGVILVTAHLGNFPLLSLKLAKEGYKVYFVTRPMRDEKAGDYLYELRSGAGVNTIFSYPRRECVSGITKALSGNGIVIMQMDQNFGSGGVWVKFFGKLAATPVGPIVLGLRTKASLVPAYIFHEQGFKHGIKIFPEEALEAGESRDHAILLNAVKFTRIIEGWIKEVPNQWSWIHRRWKSRPSEKIQSLKFKIEA